MTHVVVMGAGMVAGPAVDYLAAGRGTIVTIADTDLGRAELQAARSPSAVPVVVDAGDSVAVRRLLREADLCLSLLPSRLDGGVARCALDTGTHFVGVSNCRESGLEDLGDPARAAGLTVLPEVGLDPGLEHMSIASMKARIEARGGEVVSCRSQCGGLPAPEANTNPWGYKFSWAPMKALECTRATARYLDRGECITLPGERLFSQHWSVTVPQVGELESHYNRDSLPYLGVYGLRSAHTMIRGTLRYPGWSLLFGSLGRLGYLDAQAMENPPLTYAALMRRLVGVPPDDDLGAGLTRTFGVDVASDPIAAIVWLGLTTDEPIAWRPGQAQSPLQALADKLQEKLVFAPGERDVCVMVNELEASFSGDGRERWTSSLVEYGEPGGDSAMARTVGWTAAVCASKILSGEISVTGLAHPVLPSVYGPVLAEMERLGISFGETVEPL